LVNLRNLDLSRCDLITDKGLTSLETLTSLEELSLGWCRQITDAGIECLVRQPYRELHLRVLSLARCPITGDSMNQLGRLWSLEHLDVNGCTGIVGATFADGLKQLGRLISLDASYCPNIL
jgi:F-box/leucine-rich repeat protein 14